VADQEREPYYLAVDPGLKTGWATWDEAGDVLSMGKTNSYDELHKLLAGFNVGIKVVIIEDFTLFKHKAKEQTGSKMPAPKAIGQVETFARLWGARIEKQPSSIKPIAERMTGKHTKDYKTGRLLMAKEMTHMWDAYNHGEYYLITKKIKKQSIDELRRSIQ
jgi:hypothetical protein